jgi:hypothetical protein
MIRQLTLYVPIQDTDEAQSLARSVKDGFDPPAWNALLNSSLVADARIVALPRPEAPDRYSAILLCTSFVGDLQAYTQFFWKNLTMTFVAIGLAAVDHAFPSGLTSEQMRVFEARDVSQSAQDILQPLFQQFIDFVHRHDLTATASDPTQPPKTGQTNQFRVADATQLEWGPVGARILKQATQLEQLRSPDRVQHQKQVLAGFGIVRIYGNIPAEARHPAFQAPGEFPAAYRFSNGQPITQPDGLPDLRGFALKFFGAEGETDLLGTNEGGRSHARDATEFLEISDLLADKLANGGAHTLDKFWQDLRAGKLSLGEALHAGRILGQAVLRHVPSLATETYWGSVVSMGDRALKYAVRGDEASDAAVSVDRQAPDFFRADLLERLRARPLRFKICVQPFVDDRLTPIEDASVVWDAPVVAVGEFEISEAPSAEDEDLLRRMAFNPSHGFAPIGITVARKVAYEASAQRRGAFSTDEARAAFPDRRRAGDLPAASVTPKSSAP